MKVYVNYNKYHLRTAAIMVQKYNKYFHLIAIDEIEERILDMASRLLSNLEEFMVSSMGVTVIVDRDEQEFEDSVVRHVNFLFDARIYHETKYNSVHTPEKAAKVRLPCEAQKEIDENIISMIADEM